MVQLRAWGEVHWSKAGSLRVGASLAQESKCNKKRAPGLEKRQDSRFFSSLFCVGPRMTGQCPPRLRADLPYSTHGLKHQFLLEISLVPCPETVLYS